MKEGFRILVWYCFEVVFCHDTFEFFTFLLREKKDAAVNFHKLSYMTEHGMYVWGYIFCLVHWDKFWNPLY